MALLLLSLAMPFSGVAAAGKSGRTLLAEWSAVSRVSVIQQSSGSISYRGAWRTAYHANYMDGKARATRATSAKASLQFTGTAIAWVGPVGPSRGKARVYIDGRLVTTVNTWASTFRASRVLFAKSWAAVGTHRISIVANGTAGHPTVALDAFLVRRDRVTTPPPAPGASVRVTSIAALLDKLADNSITDIVVANGTYRVSAASNQASNSLWIGSRYASRTRAVTVRAETRGGVTFDGGGTMYFGCISFEAGAHDQTWDGFRCANGEATSTGVVTFGGAGGSGYEAPGPYRITMRHITIDRTCTGRATTESGNTFDHAFYISQALGTGPHDLLLEDITVDGRGYLASAVHFDHADSTHPNASDVTVRRLTVTGTQQAIILWDVPLRNVVFDVADITGALKVAVRYEAEGSGIRFAGITSTGSGSGTGFYSSQGSSPPGVTLSNNSFR